MHACRRQLSRDKRSRKTPATPTTHASPATVCQTLQALQTLLFIARAAQHIERLVVVLHIIVHLDIWMYVYVCMYVCMYVCIHSSIYRWTYILVHTHTHTHTHLPEREVREAKLPPALALILRVQARGVHGLLSHGQGSFEKLPALSQPVGGLVGIPVWCVYMCMCICMYDMYVLYV